MDIQQLRDDPGIWSVLEARAKALAHQEVRQSAQQDEKTVIFQLGDGRYGVAAELVREAFRLAGHTPLPGTPPFVVGLVNLRGRLLVALDIRPLLGFPPCPPPPGSMLLIVEASGMEVGLLADAVMEIRSCQTDLATLPSLADGQTVGWVRGVDRELTVQLDLALLLADPRLLVNHGGDLAAETSA
jgi:purine-binding chemotaxis protein CheW